MIVRRANISDWQDISSIDQTAWELNRNSEHIADGEHVWRLWTEYAFIGVSLENHKICGFILSFPTTEKNMFFVHKILVTPKFRGKGHGRELMVFCNDYANQHELTLKLTTDTNNVAMQQLCEKMGYKRETLCKGYYRDNEDRYIFTRQPKPLKPQSTI